MPWHDSRLDDETVLPAPPRHAHPQHLSLRSHLFKHILTGAPLLQPGEKVGKGVEKEANSSNSLHNHGGTEDESARRGGALPPRAARDLLPGPGGAQAGPGPERVH